MQTIQLLIGPADLRRMRFAYSPLAETAGSLHRLTCGHVSEWYRGWADEIRGSLRHVDMPLLEVVAPPRRDAARFMFMGAADAGTTIERQLRLVAEYPADRLRQDLNEVWAGTELPPAARTLLSKGGAGQLAEALWGYWQAAIGPYWPEIRALLDADVAYRAARLADGGIECMLGDLHPAVKLRDTTIRVGTQGPVTEHDLYGAGLLLVPCAFAWPYLEVGVGNPWPPHLIYGARGVANLWGGRASAVLSRADVLGELLGRSRAAVLMSVALPKSTTGLARELGQSPPAVSAHLSVLRRSGLVTSRRSGRRVLYQRTPLATSIITASTGAGHRAS